MHHRSISSSSASLLRQFADDVLRPGGVGEGEEEGVDDREDSRGFEHMRRKGTGDVEVGVEARGSLRETLRGLRETQGRLRRLVQETHTLERSQGRVMRRAN